MRREKNHERISAYFNSFSGSSLVCTDSFKKSAAKTYSSPIKEYLNVYVICGYGMMFLSMFITVMAYRGLDFSNVPVVESLGYVVVMLLSYLFFKEKITKKKLLGMAVILCGIFVYYR